MNKPSPEAQRTLKALEEAVHEALEKKRKLGQYAVVWRDGKVVQLEAEHLAIAKKTDGTIE